MPSKEDGINSKAVVISTIGTIPLDTTISYVTTLSHPILNFQLCKEFVFSIELEK